MKNIRSDETSAEDFDRLLAWLGGDRETGGQKYEEICRMLHDYFRRRDVVDPPFLVDEVMDRVAGKVAAVAPTYVGEPGPYFLAVARRVLAEWRRQPIQMELPPNLIDCSDSASRERKELLLQCLEECWAKHSPREQSILYRYCVETPPIKLSETRDQLAREVQMSLTALRVMAHRLKKNIRRCIEKLMAKKA